MVHRILLLNRWSQLAHMSLRIFESVFIDALRFLLRCPLSSHVLPDTLV